MSELEQFRQTAQEIVARSRAEGLVERPKPTTGAHTPRLPIMLGECIRHGWHGKTVCPACREVGQVALPVRAHRRSSPREYRLVHISQSMLRFRGGGREKVRQEARCRMCLRPRGPDSRGEWVKGTAGGKVFAIGGRSLTRHHIVPQEWFKHQPPPTRAIRSTDPNIVPLCRPCHDEVELEEEGRRMLRRVLGAEEVAFMLQLAGEDWVNAKYPPSSA